MLDWLPSRVLLYLAKSRKIFMVIDFTIDLKPVRCLNI